ncbi:biliverdin-producing heme oxygenase [Azomonas macrocytogenes]|uniref:Heme oxygenase n=1 Tax=Azomonas macrocytogenes TaxID=69962 RepID=A0A839T304_AZOMA|nr:biliverdin-producing heme oxygenase [Azomonas macrocytogenes]MBB3102103.1 heme oxygenase [Azomonas macrocytogenes]
MESLRTRLREISVAWHVQADGAFSSFPLDTQDGYRRFLEAHALALVPLEEALERRGIGRLLPDWMERRRRFVLTEDIQVLGGQIPTPARVELPENDAWLWGVAYVLEGSRMGSRMLGKKIHESDNAWAKKATGYLTHRQDEAIWPKFVACLEEAADRLDEHSAIAGTKQAFELFLQAGRAKAAQAS